jgi:hypothetical protein
VALRAQLAHEYRIETVDYMAANEDDIRPFVNDDDETFEHHLARMRSPDAYADQPEIIAFALARQKNVVIFYVTGNTPLGYFYNPVPNAPCYLVIYSQVLAKHLGSDAAALEGFDTTGHYQALIRRDPPTLLTRDEVCRLFPHVTNCR